jgi:hypothetical protein
MVEPLPLRRLANRQGFNEGVEVMVKSSRRAWDEGLRITRVPHDPDAHVISTYYNHTQRERHNAARRAAMVEIGAGAKAMLWGAVAGLAVVLYAYWIS